MSKIIGTHIIGNNLYIIKKRGLWDAIRDSFSGHEEKLILNIEKPIFEPIMNTCHPHIIGNKCRFRRGKHVSNSRG